MFLRFHTEGSDITVNSNFFNVKMDILGHIRRFTDENYQSMHAKQLAAITEVTSNPLKPILFLGEHRPVITLGRGTDRRNILAPTNHPDLLTTEIVDSERGGDVTYHGPGQLVGYPIMALEHLPKGRDLHAYLRDLEEVQIRALTHFGLQGERKDGFTGVWLDGGSRKIASIGVAVKKWVTYHGFALNVRTNLSAFRVINPCGLDANVMTSMAEELGKRISMDEVVKPVVAAFEEIFKIKFVEN